MAYRILVPQLGIEPVSPTVEAQTLRHCTTMEVPYYSFNFLISLFILIGG